MNEIRKSLRLSMARRRPDQIVAVDAHATLWDERGETVKDARSVTIVIDDDGIGTMTVVRLGPKDVNGKRERGVTVTEEYELSMLMVEGWLVDSKVVTAEEAELEGVAV